MSDLNIARMNREHMDAVLGMWRRLLEMTALVNPWYRLASDAVPRQRDYFLRAEKNPNAFCFVALSRGEAVGFVNGFISIPSDVFLQIDLGFIENLYVEEPFRRAGIGSELVDRCYEWFRGREISDVYVNVVPANKLSLEFWQNRDFEVHKMTMARTIE